MWLINASVSAAAAVAHRSRRGPPAGRRVRFRLLQHEPAEHRGAQRQLSGERAAIAFIIYQLILLTGQHHRGHTAGACGSVFIVYASIFQILESKRAVLEGLVPENINGLNK